MTDENQNQTEFTPMPTPEWVIDHMEAEGSFFYGLKTLEQIRNRPFNEIEKVMGSELGAIQLVKCIDQIIKLSPQQKNNLLDLVLPKPPTPEEFADIPLNTIETEGVYRYSDKDLERSAYFDMIEGKKSILRKKQTVSLVESIVLILDHEYDVYFGESAGDGVGYGVWKYKGYDRGRLEFEDENGAELFIRKTPNKIAPVQGWILIPEQEGNSEMQAIYSET